MAFSDFGQTTRGCPCITALLVVLFYISSAGRNFFMNSELGRFCLPQLEFIELTMTELSNEIEQIFQHQEPSFMLKYSTGCSLGKHSEK